jgi:hypothetical protein
MSLYIGMQKHVFLALVQELQDSGLDDSKFITLEEQTAIFLYTCVTGLKSRHVVERFQHLHTTITKFFFSSPFSSVYRKNQVLQTNSSSSLILAFLQEICLHAKR